MKVVISIVIICVAIVGSSSVELNKFKDNEHTKRDVMATSDNMMESGKATAEASTLSMTSVQPYARYDGLGAQQGVGAGLMFNRGYAPAATGLSRYPTGLGYAGAAYPIGMNVMYAGGYPGAYTQSNLGPYGLAQLQGLQQQGLLGFQGLNQQQGQFLPQRQQQLLNAQQQQYLNAQQQQFLSPQQQQFLNPQQQQAFLLSQQQPQQQQLQQLSGYPALYPQFG